MAALGAGRLVVVSPHLDDAIMSLGATIAWAVRAGAAVEVLTVFAYSPTSTAPAGPWDTRCGFKTEAEACLARRNEDREACRILGATPRWFDFGAEPYERGAPPDEILSAVTAAVAGADIVLMPGYPLTHPDHAELVQLLLTGRIGGRRGLYAEQPYRFYQRKSPDTAMRADALEPTLTDRLCWTHQPVGRIEQRMKTQAVRSYRTQIWALGLSRVGLFRMLWHERRQGGEAIAWLPSAGPPSAGVASGGLASGGLASGGLASGGLASGGLASGGLTSGGLPAA